MFEITKEIIAKTMLLTTKHPEYWFGIKYNMNIYKGCEHRCIYCDSRSDCYRIENFDEVQVKINALDILKKELSAKRVKGLIGTGAMSDPYTYTEKKYNLTGKALELIEAYGFSVHIITKSDLILKDIETLKKINRNHASVAFTITTTDDNLSRKVEIAAPVPSKRFEAMKALSKEGIYTGVTMMPILPFVEDNVDNIKDIVEKTAENGGRYIMPAFGMTMRSGQREHYYKMLDKSFPGLKEQYKAKYGYEYSCNTSNKKELYEVFKKECKKYGIITTMKEFIERKKFEQTSLF